MKFSYYILLAAIVLEATLAVQSASVADDAPSTTKSTVKKSVAKGQPKIRRTIRVRESPTSPSPDSPAAPQAASANSTVNNEGPVNSVEVKPEISVSTGAEQKQESPASSVPVEAVEPTTEKPDSPEEEEEEEEDNGIGKDKPKKKKGKGKKKRKPKPARKLKSKSRDDDDDDDGFDEKDSEKDGATEAPESSQQQQQPIQISQEQNVVQQKLNDLDAPQASADNPPTTTTTQAPQEQTSTGNITPAGEKVQQTVLNNVGNKEVVEMNGVGNKKVIKITDSGNEEEIEKEGKKPKDNKKKKKKKKKAKKEKCSHPSHNGAPSVVHHHHHYHNKDSGEKKEEQQQPVVQVNIQAQEPQATNQVAAVLPVMHPQAAPHPTLVQQQPGFGPIMAQPMVNGHMMQPLMVQPMAQQGPLIQAPMGPPLMPMLYPYGYPQPPKEKKSKKKNKKSKKTSTTTTTPAPTTTSTTTAAPPTTTTTEQPTTTTEKIEWEVVRIPKRKLKDVITGKVDVLA